MGVSLTVETTLPDVLAERFTMLERLFHEERLLDEIGLLVETQTRDRIDTQKTSPAGAMWPEWSTPYQLLVENRQEAAEKKAGRTSRGPHHTMLRDSGALYDSITHNVLMGGLAGAVQVGSNLVYAATHQYGDETRGIPQREFIGLSDENRHELDQLVRDYVVEIMS